MVGEIKVDVPEGLPLNDLRKRILEMIKEEESKLASFDRSKEPLQKEQRKKILDKYYGIIKLDRIVSIDEILVLEEDAYLRQRL
jgi:hypothetical protein